jgi:hypothetical protein
MPLATHVMTRPGPEQAMKKYNATRKLRKVAQGIIAQQRMTKALEALRGGMGSASIKDPVDVS